MTKQEAIAEVKRLIQYDSPLPDTDESILKSIQESMIQCNYITRILWEYKDVSVPANSNKIDLETNHHFHPEHLFWLQGTNRIRLFRYDSLDNYTIPPGQPARYIVLGSSVYLFPTPTSAGTLQYRSLRYPPNLADLGLTDPLPLPLYLHRSIVQYAAGIWLEYVANHPPGQRGERLKQEALELWKLVRAEQDEARRLEDTVPTNDAIGFITDILKPFDLDPDSSLINPYLKEAIKMFFLTTKHYQDRYEIPVPAGTQFVHLTDTTAIHVNRIELRNSSGGFLSVLKSPSIEWFVRELTENIDLAGRPTEYLMYGNRIELYPKPDQNYQLVLKGVFVPSHASSVIELIPSSLVHSVCEYTASLILPKSRVQGAIEYANMLRNRALELWNRYSMENELHTVNTNPIDESVYKQVMNLLLTNPLVDRKIRRAEIAVAIKEAVKAFFAYTKSYLDWFVIQTAPNQMFVPITQATVLSIEEVYRIDGQDHLLLTREPFHISESRIKREQFPKEIGAPLYYTQVGNTIRFRPIPDDVYTIRVLASMVPPTEPITDSSISTGIEYVPSELHMTIARFAAGLILQGFFSEKGGSQGDYLISSCYPFWEKYKLRAGIAEAKHDRHDPSVLYPDYWRWGD